MRKISVLDAGTLGEDMDLGIFSEFGEVKVFRVSPPETLPERVSDAEILIINKIRITGELLAQAKHLRLICVAATGYDNIDLAACRESGIAVCNVPGYSTDSVAQVTLAMVFSLATHLRDYEEYVRAGRYSAGTDANCLVPVYRDLVGKTWGIVGYGNIGARVASVAEAMGCRVLVTRAHPAGDPRETDLDTLCRESDIITLHIPLTGQTRGMIGRKQISFMKPDVILVNVARGAVTDESAVAEAILSGKIGAFGCDVYSCEPFGAEHPFDRLRGCANVCLTPHMAWGSFDSRTRCLRIIAENIREFLSGGVFHRVDLQ